MDLTQVIVTLLSTIGAFAAAFLTFKISNRELAVKQREQDQEAKNAQELAASEERTKIRTELWNEIRGLREQYSQEVNRLRDEINQLRDERTALSDRLKGCEAKHEAADKARIFEREQDHRLIGNLRLQIEQLQYRLGVIDDRRVVDDRRIANQQASQSAVEG